MIRLERNLETVNDQWRKKLRMWTIIKYTLLSNVKDVKTMISHVLSPIILMVILGSALSGAFDATSLGNIKVGIVVGKETDFSENLRTYFNEETDYVTLVEYETFEAVKDAVESGDVSVAIEIPKDMDEKIAAGEKSEVSLWTANKNSYQTTVVSTLLSACMDATNTILTEIEYGTPNPSYELKETLDDNTITIDGNRAGSMDYYAVTIMVMTLMYGTAVSAKEFEVNLKGEMGKRLRNTSAGTVSVLSGKIISSIVIIFIQGMIIVLLSKFVFGANWGDNIGLIMGYVALGSLFSAELGIMVCILVNNAELVGGVLTMLVPAMTLMSGGFFKFSFGGIEKAIPSYQLQNLVFQTVYQGSKESINGSLIYMLALIVVMFAVSVLLGGKKKVW